MVAAYVPARRAAKVAPVAAMRDDARRHASGAGPATVLGGVAMLVGVAAGGRTG